MSSQEEFIHLGGNPAICCLPGAWDRASINEIRTFGNPLPPAVADIAAAEGVDPHRLDYHVEMIHGWRPSRNDGYATAVAAAVECVKNGGICV